jgi:hypothetical protein
MEEIAVREHAEQEFLQLINRLFPDERRYEELAALFAPMDAGTGRGARCRAGTPSSRSCPRGPQRCVSAT